MTTNRQDTVTTSPKDSLISCRADEFIAAAKGHRLSSNMMGATGYPPYAVVACGSHFKIYYNDLLNGAPAAGFADLLPAPIDGLLYVRY